MSQSALNPPSPRRTFRRYGIFVGAAVAASMLAGVVTAALSSGTVTSVEQVGLPATNMTAGAAVTTGIGSPVVIAALPKFGPGAPAGAVQVIAVKPYVLQVTAQGGTPAQAKAVANSVAQGYIAFDATAGPAGHIPAMVLQSTTNASGPAQPARLLIGALLGLASGLLTGIVATLAHRRLIMTRRPFPG